MSRFSIKRVSGCLMRANPSTNTPNTRIFKSYIAFQTCLILCLLAENPSSARTLYFNPRSPFPTLPATTTTNCIKFTVFKYPLCSSHHLKSQLPEKICFKLVIFKNNQSKIHERLLLYLSTISNSGRTIRELTVSIEDPSLSSWNHVDVSIWLNDCLLVKIMDGVNGCAIILVRNIRNSVSSIMWKT